MFTMALIPLLLLLVARFTDVHDGINASPLLVAFHSSLMQVVPTVDTILLPTARTTTASTILVLNHSPLSKMTATNTQSV